ncbi:CBM35 domain-containing protein [Pseudobacteroides cellulosolvens]|uniref:Type 3a cellulose-binding domain protein n=1 Tax=Pseudobacteroides cellulosolvens ATCC 35603 = DSM 2933 TaxID=398512 RepID=A0A0L6JI78_9FIRM|nr:CBM35 domain-containing protein [Pseudobacteroides cellulosolvens]KNY25393.1 type 3a cellulose-binding domain protein [Pseudobacteroides cellulosolvens ATCC 35603 = DSM 2933]
MKLKKLSAVLVTAFLLMSNIFVNVSFAAAPSKLKVLYNNNGTAANSNQIYANIKLVNLGTSNIDLSKITIRYYFTKDSDKPLVYYTDYVSMGSMSTKFNAHSPASAKADTYFEIKPSSGTISTSGAIWPKQSEVIFQGRVARKDWSNFDQSNDHSYTIATREYIENPYIAVFESGKLIAGNVPYDASQLKYEAENANLSGKAFVANDHSGYSGTGFVCGYGNDGAKTLFTVNVPESGNYSIKVGYSNASEAEKSLSIYVNGKKTGQIKFARLSSWSTWSEAQAIVPLNNGENTISLQRDIEDGGSVNLDYLLIEPGTIPDVTIPDDETSKFKYEAENAGLSGNAVVANDHSGYSGTGFVCGYGNIGAKALFTVNVPKEGDYIIKVRYANASEAEKSLSLYVNAVKTSQIKFSRFTSWSNWSEVQASVHLNSGANTISLQRDIEDGGSVNLDYLLIE